MSTGAPNPTTHPPIGHGAHPDLGHPSVYALARRIYFNRFSERVARAGIDPEDGMQCVSLGLLTRSRSASRWDPARGGLSTWLFVATKGIVLNLLDQHRRLLRRSGSVGAGQDAALAAAMVEAAGEAEEGSYAAPRGAERAGGVPSVARK